jgi:hypothetical protein
MSQDMQKYRLRMDYSVKTFIHEFQLRIAILSRAVVALSVHRLATGWTTKNLISL